MKTGAPVPMKISGQRTVVRGEPGTNRPSCAFPQVTVLPGRHWLAGCRAACRKHGTTRQHVLLARPEYSRSALLTLTLFVLY